ncbi:MAG TPA: FHA domain-containing protein [Candidatus Sumerlaeota bacterium]|nr:FHA domain-containing protein [Candidatus Sumerlaeota bacterium]
MTDSSYSNSDETMAMIPELSVLIGPEAGKRYPLNKPVITIGRGDDRDVQFDDRAMSRRHCEVHVRSGAFFIHDTGSQNGIRVNGRETTDQELYDGDQLDIGSIRLIVHIPVPGESS